MKVKRNKWQKQEVGCYGNFVTLKALRIINKNNAYYGIEYIDKANKFYIRIKAKLILKVLNKKGNKKCML